MEDVGGSILYYVGGLILGFADIVILLLMLYWKSIRIAEALFVLGLAFGIFYLTLILYDMPDGNFIEVLAVGLLYAAGAFFWITAAVLVYLFWRMKNTKSDW